LLLKAFGSKYEKQILIWRELRAKYFNNKTFTSLKLVDDHLEFALIYFAKDKNAVKRLTKINYL